MALILRLNDGAELPACYGIAWRTNTWHEQTNVCMPVPLNLLARVLRDVWLYLRHPGSVPVNPRAAFADGYRAGRSAHVSTMDDTDYLMYADQAAANDKRTMKCS